MFSIMFRALHTLAGLACATVPFAIAIHLGAELLALGSVADMPAFFSRHAYLLVPLALTLRSFCVTVGLGRERREIVRRCAIARARLRSLGQGSTIVGFTAANLAFFTLTQLIEAVPIAAGSLATGLVAAVVGSLLAALIVFFWGRAVAGAALALVTRAALPRGDEDVRVTFTAAAPRSAFNAYTLCIPNRPPPSASFC